MTMSRASWMGIYRAITARIDFVEALERTRVPVLYLYGKESKYRAVGETNARRFSESHPNIGVVAFRNGIHDLHLQYPDEVDVVVEAALGRPRAGIWLPPTRPRGIGPGSYGRERSRC